MRGAPVFRVDIEPSDARWQSSESPVAIVRKSDRKLVAIHSAALTNKPAIVGMNGPGGMSYYLSVSEFVASPDQSGDGFRINGKVAEGTIVRESTGQDVAFVVSDGEAALPVRYHGIILKAFHPVK